MIPLPPCYQQQLLIVNLEQWRHMCTHWSLLQADWPQEEPQSESESFYLLKSEPHEFSIDDLAAAKDQTEPWDGVRNYQAIILTHCN